jgi:uncharacterized SAM-binding protein YcdF (DUF218 family)
MRRKRQVIIPAIAMVGVLLFGAREPILFAVGNFLVIEDALQPADVIHVISGPDDRTDYAIRLYKQGYGKQIFFTGGWCIYHRYRHAEHGFERTVAQGIPQDNIALDDSEVTSTYGEVVRLREFIALSATHVRSVIVVSDPYHMRRARWTYEKVLGGEISVQMAAVPFGTTPYQRRWWQDRASRQYVANEYLKMFYYLARYQLAFGPVKDWLASLDRE